MDLITQLENKFQKIEAKLNEKNELISGNYSIDIAQLKALDESIKSKNSIFAKGLASVYESIWFRSKFTCPFKFAQLVKYKKFMKNEKKFCLPKENLLFYRGSRSDEHIFIHVLWSDLLFIYKCVCVDYGVINQINMGVMNHSGEVIHSKSILKQENKFLDYEFKVNATNIIAHNPKNSIVEIYNFKLELVHSIKKDKNSFFLKLNNYEIIFDNNTYYECFSSFNFSFIDSAVDDTAIKQLIITCYNYQTVHTKKTKMEICLDENGFEEKFFELIGVNDRFFFIGGRCEKYSRSTRICLLNREDENRIYKSFKCKFEICFVFNVEVCGRTFVGNVADDYKRFVNVYDIDNSDSDKPSAIFKDDKVRSIADILASGNKYIYSKDMRYYIYKQY